MTDIDMSTGTLWDYLVAMLAFWAAFVAIFLLFALYLWPRITEAYWCMAKRLYWFFRDYIRSTRGHDRSRYTGY